MLSSMAVMACRSYGNVVMRRCRNCAFEYKQIYISVSKVARYAFLSASRWHAGFIRSLRIKMVLKMERINAVLITIVRHNGVVSSVTMDGAAGVVGA